ncbi:ATPase inhibitor mai-2, mitochondrial [Aethina tumida]|uniref:ATPase inhibitor mai-2, mitochondrial n=1 Tax=Aethina tumida TaxID=116153 RepID=UPI00096B6167|nr:ATPase inhibitor mai-2, mitochondrial [Aethina tumida]XP_049826840.1 ATPase inhibitor mai-2, mitochondrial [Aethina tumida]
MSLLRVNKLFSANLIKNVRLMSQIGDLGSGAGKGGGGGGSIREAGGAFGKIEAGREEEYFYKKQREQLQKLKSDLNDEISFHEEQIKRHQEAIARHKERVTELDKKE